MNNIIEERNILLHAEADSWEEALKVSGRLLLESGYILPEYIDKTIETVKKMGSYIVIGPGLALAHSRPDNSVLKTGISLVTLKKPLDFGSDLGPVNVVITLAAKDSNSHIDKLQVIAGLFSNEEKMSLICKAEDAKQVADMFNTYEE